MRDEGQDRLGDIMEELDAEIEVPAVRVRPRPSHLAVHLDGFLGAFELDDDLENDPTGKLWSQQIQAPETEMSWV